MKKNLITLWKTSIPKSKTWQQKQRKSQGTSEAQGPTLGHLDIVKLQEMFLALSPGPVDSVPNILCYFFLPFSWKMGNCSQIVFYQQCLGKASLFYIRYA